MDHDKRSERRGAKWLLVVAAALVALVATASAQGKSTRASADPVTLKVFDANNDPGPNAEQIELIKRFEAANPGVTIKRTSVPFNNFLNTVKLNLSSSDAPDVSDGNQGPQIDGALVKGKLITPLTDYAKKFGWNKLWTPTTLAPNTFSTDGTQFGTGTLWGVSSRAEIVGVYYNKTKLKALGMAVPKTFADFEKILAASKAKGQPPFMIGNLDKYPGGHYMMTLADHYSSPAALRNWVFGRKGATFDTPAVRKAAAKLQQWAKAGYFKAFNSVKDSDLRLLRQGRGSVRDRAGDVGQRRLHNRYQGQRRVLPPASRGGRWPDQGNGLRVAADPHQLQVEEPRMAAKFLNYLTTAEAANIILQKGDLPARPLANPKVDPKSSIASIVAAWRKTSQSPNLVPYMDWPTPTMFDTLMGGVQSLMAGQKSPEDFTKSVQDDWAKYHKG